MLKERVKFYADTPKGEMNKLFIFTSDTFHWEECIKRFIRKGFYIRAAWFETIDIETGEIKHNLKVPMVEIYESLKPGRHHQPGELPLNETYKKKL